MNGRFNRKLKVGDVVTRKANAFGIRTVGHIAHYTVSRVDPDGVMVYIDCHNEWRCEHRRPMNQFITLEDFEKYQEELSAS